MLSRLNGGVIINIYIYIIINVAGFALFFCTFKLFAHFFLFVAGFYNFSLFKYNIYSKKK